MPSFSLSCALSPSKSIHNRLLILEDQLGMTNALSVGTASDDVRHMKKALQSLKQKTAERLVLDIGEGGTVLRFLFPYLLTKPGKYKLLLKKPLFERPMDGLENLAKQFSASFSKDSSRNEIFLDVPEDVSVPNELMLDVDKSSQFLSGAIMACAGKKGKLRFIYDPASLKSEAYLLLTTNILEKFNVKVEKFEQGLMIDYSQFAAAESNLLEPDMSSAASIAAVAAVSGKLVIEGFPKTTDQADFIFIELFKQMGIPIHYVDGSLTVQRAEKLSSLNFDIGKAPDLFPVLSMLMARSSEEGRLFGGEILRFKESDRIRSVGDILEQTGRNFEIRDDGVYFPQQKNIINDAKVHINTNFDHRIAFAGAVLQASGFEVSYDDKYVVNKSFQNFWELLKDGGIK